MRKASSVPIALTIVVVFVACDAGPGRSPVPQPSPAMPPAPAPAPAPPPVPPPVPTDARQIAVGEEVKDTIVSQERNYEVAAPSEGVIAVRLEWKNDSGGGPILTLKVNGAEVQGGCAAIDSRVTVGATRSVMLTVGRIGDGCWNYGDAIQGDAEFVLTTSMQ